MTRVLLLNASFEPLSVVSDRDAVCMYLDGDVDVVEYSGREFHSPSTTVLVPSVMRLVKYVILPKRFRSVLLTPSAVLARDNYTCAYCGKDDLEVGKDGTMDHIIPRSKGGKNVWENVTAACAPCNRAKGSRTLDEMIQKWGSPDKWGRTWELNRTPTRPKGIWASLMTGQPDPSWQPYLQVA